jgi:hypothetical protein
MKTEAFPLAPEIISGHKIGQDRTTINVSPSEPQDQLAEPGFLTRGLPLFEIHAVSPFGSYLLRFAADNR